MSSKKEERDQKRMDSARSIQPGWTPMPLARWNPKEHKPKKGHLKKAAEERNQACPIFRTAQDYVTWLSLNGPDGAAAASSVVGTYKQSTGVNDGTVHRPIMF